MAGPERPRFVLFGSSIVESSFSHGGWGASLTHLYARKADITLRGYGGWNSTNALHVLNDVFPKDSPIKPDLVIVYFGDNDSMLPNPWGLGHVPLPQFIRNMEAIASHLKNISETTRTIFLTASPVNSDQIREVSPIFADLRPMESLKKYSETTIEICKKMDIKYVDLFNAIQRREDWLETSFTDGIHFTEVASNVVVNEILKVLKDAEWEPSLHPDSLPIEFNDIVLPIDFDLQIKELFTRDVRFFRGAGSPNGAKNLRLGGEWVRGWGRKYPRWLNGVGDGNCIPHPRFPNPRPVYFIFFIFLFLFFLNFTPLISK